MPNDASIAIYELRKDVRRIALVACRGPLLSVLSLVMAASHNECLRLDALSCEKFGLCLRVCPLSVV